MSDIFVSYASEDRPRGEEFARALEGQGWTVFWDRTIPIGKTWRETIGRELSEARCVIVLWSKTSIDSSWVQEEADDARRRGVLVPVLIDKVVPPIGFRSVQAADLADWDKKETTQAFRRLRADIAALVGSAPGAAPPGARPAPTAPRFEPGTPTTGRWSRGRIAAIAGGVLGVIVLVALWQSSKDSPSAPSVSTPAPQVPAAAPDAAAPAPAAGSYVAAPAPAPAAQPAPADLSQAPPNAEQAPPSAARDTGVSLTELAMRMKNEPSVASAIIGATKVLAAADKTPELTTEGCAKDPKVNDFYRGMMLAHAGYYLVIADLQTGSYRNYGFPTKDYSLLDKASLYAFWTKERISKAWRESNALASLGPDDKRALSVFLSELQSYRAIYALVKRAKPNLDAINWGLGGGIPVEEVSEILRRAGRPPISKCYENEYGYKLNWNATASGSTEIDFEPASYMIGFWHRRDAEGKSDLADWFLSTMAGWLKS
jgi:TIR domain